MRIRCRGSFGFEDDAFSEFIEFSRFGHHNDEFGVDFFAGFPSHIL